MTISTLHKKIRVTLEKFKIKNLKSFLVNWGHVFTECFRVLKAHGLMVFSFHHSKPEAWGAIYQAITVAQFTIVASHPVKAEMSVSTTKSATQNPINLDAIIVCKKEDRRSGNGHDDSSIWENAQKRL